MIIFEKSDPRIAVPILLKEVISIFDFGDLRLVTRHHLGGEAKKSCLNQNIPLGKSVRSSHSDSSTIGK